MGRAAICFYRIAIALELGELHKDIVLAAKGRKESYQGVPRVSALLSDVELACTAWAEARELRELWSRARPEVE